MPKPKHQEKKKRSKKESDSEEEQSEEQESENNSEEQSEEDESQVSEEEDEKSESGSGSEEPSENEKEESENSGSESERSEKSSNRSGSSEENSDGSGSEEKDNSESDEDSDNEKKKKGKSKKKNKGKDKGKGKKGKEVKKGKEKEKESPKSLSKKTTFDLNQNLISKAPTISSVSQELDELASHLSQIFPLFRNNQDIRSPKSPPPVTKKFYEDILYQSPSQTIPGQTLQQFYLPVNQESNTLKVLRKPNSEPNFDLSYKNLNQTIQPTKEDKGIQYEGFLQKKTQASPEAIRAVKEYKKRKEQEKKRKNYVDQSVGSAHDFIDSDFHNQNDYEKKQTKPLENNEVYKDRRRSDKEERKHEEYIAREREREKEKEKKEYFPGRSGSQWSKSNKIAEDYYGGIIKKAGREFSSPSKRTVKDLYSHTPKPMYVESGKPLDKYTANGTQIRRSQQVIDRYEQKFRQSGTINRSDSETNKKDISDAVEVLMRKSKQK